MKSIFLSPDQIFRKQLSLLETVGTAAPASDLALLTVEDDGFVTDGPAINYYLGEGGCVDRFGRENDCEICAVRPAIMLEEGEESLLEHRQQDGEGQARGAEPAAQLKHQCHGGADKERGPGGVIVKCRG